ncbi:MAG: PepSY domain-containing protein [Byssovorax sp.]
MKHVRLSLALATSLALAAPMFGLAAIAHAEATPHVAKFPRAAARAKALAQVPGGTVVAEEVEFESKRWIYSFEIKPKGETGKLIKEVNLDADTGDLISVDTEQD